MARKRLTGYTENTMKNRQMNSGIFFKNFDIENDTVESAIARFRMTHIFEFIFIMTITSLLVLALVTYRLYGN